MLEAEKLSSGLSLVAYFKVTTHLYKYVFEK